MIHTGFCNLICRFAVDFIPFAVEFVSFAVEFGALALEFVAFAQKVVNVVTLAASNQLSSQGRPSSPWRIPLETLEDN